MFNWPIPRILPGQPGSPEWLEEQRRKKEEEERRNKVEQGGFPEIPSYIGIPTPVTGDPRFIDPNKPSGGDGGGGGDDGSDTYSPPTEHERTGLDRLAEYMSMRGMPGQYTSSLNALEMLLSGKPTAGFSEYVEDPLRRGFESETLPGIREEYVGPGTYWGGERAGAVAKGYEGLEDTIGKLRYAAEESALSRALQAAPQLATLSSYGSELPLRQAKAGLGMGGLERGIADKDFMFAYQDFLRSQPSMDSGLMQLILALLGQSQQAWQQ